MFSVKHCKIRDLHMYISLHTVCHSAEFLQDIYKLETGEEMRHLSITLDDTCDQTFETINTT